MAETPLAQSLIFITAAVIAVAPFSLLRMPAATGVLSHCLARGRAAARLGFQAVRNATAFHSAMALRR